jgi:hypothetical protein
MHAMCPCRSRGTVALYPTLDSQLFEDPLEVRAVLTTPSCGEGVAVSWARHMILRGAHCTCCGRAAATAVLFRTPLRALE